MTFKAILCAVTNIAGFVLVWLAIQRSPITKKVRVLFFITTLFVLAWIDCSYLASASATSSQVLLFTRLNNAAVSGFLVSFYFFFVKYFLVYKNVFFEVLITIGSVSFAVLSFFTPLIIKSAAVFPWGIDVIFGPLNLFLGIFSSLVAAICIFRALRTYSLSDTLEREKLVYFFTGVVIFSVLSVVFNVVLPNLGVTKFKFVGDYAAVLLLGLTSYAVIQERLFGIRVLFQRKKILNFLALSILGLPILIGIYLAAYFSNIVGFTAHSLVNFGWLGLIVSIIALLFALLGIFVLKSSRKRQEAKLFFGLAFSATAWIVFNYLTDFASPTMLWLRLTYIAAIFAVLFTLLLIMEVSNHKNTLTRRIIGTSSFIMAVMACIPHVAIESFSRVESGVNVVNGPLAIVFPIYGLMCLVGAVIMFVQGSRHAHPKEKSKLTLFALGIVLAFAIGFATNALIPYLTGNYGIAKYGTLATTIVLISCTVGILQDRLFGIRVVFEQKLLKTSIGIVLLGTLLLLSGLFLHITGHLNSQASIIAILIFAFFFYPSLLRKTESWVERHVLRYHHSPAAILQQLAKKLTNTIDIKAISHLLVEDLSRDLNLTAAAYYEPTEQFGQFIYKFGKTGTAIAFPRQFTLPQSLYRLLHQKTCLDRSILEEETVQHHKARNLIDQLSIETVVPLLYQSRLIGLLILGEKKRHEAFSVDETQMLDTLSVQLSTNIHRAQLFERTRSFAKELEKQVQVATKQLQQTNQKLKEVNESRDRFFADIAHEFKTPLTIFRGNLDLLAKHANPEDLKIVSTELNRLESLTGDLMELSRAESGEQGLRLNTINPQSFFQRLTEEVASIAEERHITIHQEVANSSFMADRDRIAKLTHNLLSNAIKYGRPNGNIWLHYSKKEVENDQKLHQTHLVTIEIRDDGPGIAAQHLPHLFERFYRVDKRQSRALGGTGLGLAIVKSIAELHGGTVSVHSKPGRGSTFRVIIPQPFSLHP